MQNKIERLNNKKNNLDYVNVSLAKEKNIFPYEVYLNLENAYKYLFEKFFLINIDLKAYEEKLMNNKLFINEYKFQKEIEKEDYINSKFFVLVNNFFVEKLSIEQINILNKFLVTSQIDSDNIMLVKDSYKDIIKNNYLKNNYSDKIYKICYGSVTPSNFADNDALVLKLFYSDDPQINLSGEDYINNLKKQQEFINSIKEELSTEVYRKLGIKCEILVDRK